MKKVILKYIDFSHGFAYDTLTRPVQTVLNAVAAGETDEEDSHGRIHEGSWNSNSGTG